MKVILNSYAVSGLTSETIYGFSVLLFFFSFPGYFQCKFRIFYIALSLDDSMSSYLTRIKKLLYIYRPTLI